MMDLPCNNIILVEWSSVLQTRGLFFQDHELTRNFLH